MIIKENNIGTNDLNAIADIWLESNIDAHNFISAAYWKSNYSSVKKLLPTATIFLFKKEKQVVAFLGLSKNYIAGIFVKKEYRNQGIGKQLLEIAKKECLELNLSVYKNNSSALNFYLSQGFIEESESIDLETNELEIHMKWIR